MKLVEYATRRQVHAALTVVGASGIAMSFFPFAYEYVPIRDIFPGGFLEPEWWSVLPCVVLPFPITIGYGLWLTRGSLPRWYATVAYCVAGLSIGPFMAAVVIQFGFDDVEAVGYTALFVAAFVAAAGLVLWGSSRDQRLDSLVAMQAVYIAEMQYWLAFAVGDYQTGAWLAVASAFAWLVQITLIAKRRVWLFALLVPAAALTVEILVES